MKLLVMLLLALAIPAAHAACDWNAPGSSRYTGRLADAVDAYRDIPATVRSELKAKIEAHRFDDLVEIRRDSVDSRHWTYGQLRDMHWSRGLCRGEVNRSAWSATAREGAAVYCVGEACIIVPAVCGNVARITRTPRPIPEDQAGPVPPPAPPLTDFDLPYEPTGAGRPPGPDAPVTFSGLTRPVEPAPVTQPTPTPVSAPLGRAPFGSPPWLSPIYLSGPAVAPLPAVVPEVPIWLMVPLGGVLLLGLRRRRQRRR